jgi:formylglycine-generating enzyme required for sulfatase activity
MCAAESFANDLYRESHALVVGVSDYDRGWSDLPGVRADVVAIANLLEEHDFDSVTTVLDESKAQVCSALEKFLLDHGRQPENKLLIYYAGHAETVDGLSIASGDAGWCPDVGSHRDNDGQAPTSVGVLVMPESPVVGQRSASTISEFVESGIRFDAFRAAVEAPEVLARHVMVVFDSCFSGALFNTRSGVRLINPVERRSPELEVLLQNSSRLYLTSGSEGQEVPDQSRFRRFFVEGLQGQADLDGDGFVLGLELVWFVRGKVTTESGARQTPMFLNSGRARAVTRGEVVFESPLGVVEVRQTEPEAAESKRDEVGHLGQFQDACPLCPVMTHLPGGSVALDVDTDVSFAVAADDPAKEHSVSDFAISKTPITIAQWNECFKMGGCDTWFGSSDASRGRHPVTGLSLEQASQYVQWLQALTGQTYRLPTEVEWEYAARAGSSTPRPWGFEVGVNNAHCRGCGDSQYEGETVEVGSYPANAFGLHDMLGNVWEWTSSCWHEKGAELSEAAAALDSDCQQGVIRGGSFSTRARFVTSSVRAPYPVSSGFSNIGFRVVSEL